MNKALRNALVLSVVILLVGNQIFASQWEWGLKAGIVRSKADFSKDLPYITVESLDAFSVGSFLSFFLIDDNFGIQPELNYSIKGFDVVEEDLGEKISSKYKISTIEIPVLLAYRFPLKGCFKPGLVFGPYVGFAHKEMDDNLKKMDFGLVFGGNVRYRLGSINVLLSVRYSLGLVNISKNIMDVSYDFLEDDTIKNRAFTVSLGVSFIPRGYR